MSPESYGWDTIEAAEELYILDGLTFGQVAERTGVSVSQLKRWSADSTPSWPERRKEYREAQVSVRRGVMIAKAKLIESVINTEDPQKAYAFGALVGAGKIVDQEARERTAAAAPAPPASGGQDQPVDMIEGLSTALEAKIASLMTRPNAITLTAIKELQQAMALIEQLKAKIAEAAGEGERAQGASAATIDSLRDAIAKGLSA